VENAALELAGFYVAHAIWNVSEAEEGELLCPMLAFSDAETPRKMQRLVDESEGGQCWAVGYGRESLTQNRMDAEVAALVFEGLVTTNAGAKSDAILAEVRSYSPQSLSVDLVVPFTPASSGRFQVHRPQVIRSHGSTFNVEQTLSAFFRGVSEHPRGDDLWAQFSNPGDRAD
jgi:hypothetical protein